MGFRNTASIGRLHFHLIDRTDRRVHFPRDAARRLIRFISRRIDRIQLQTSWHPGHVVRPHKPCRRLIARGDRISKVFAPWHIHHRRRQRIDARRTGDRRDRRPRVPMHNQRNPIRGPTWIHPHQTQWARYIIAEIIAELDFPLAGRIDAIPALTPVTQRAEGPRRQVVTKVIPRLQQRALHAAGRDESNPELANAKRRHFVDPHLHMSNDEVGGHRRFQRDF